MSSPGRGRGDYARAVPRTAALLTLIFILMALAFAAGVAWEQRGSENSGSCVRVLGQGSGPERQRSPRIQPPPGIGVFLCSSDEAVRAHEERHSVVCMRWRQHGINGRGLYRCLARQAVEGGAAQSAVRPCASSDLVGSVGFTGTTGFAVGTLMFRNESDSACRPGGRPRVRIFINGVLTNPTQYPLIGEDSRTRRVFVLHPRQSAGVRLWWANYCGARDRLRVVVRVRLTTGARLALKDPYPKPANCQRAGGRGSGLGVGVFRLDPAS